MRSNLFAVSWKCSYENMIVMGRSNCLDRKSQPAQTHSVGIDKRIGSDFDPARQWPFISPLTTLR
jgi:hypothetical protein